MSDEKTITFSQKVAYYDQVFTKHIVQLIDAIHEITERDNSEKFVSLSNRINFNHYYSEFLTSARR